MKISLNVNGRQIGPGQPVYIVAEMSANHNQDFDQAVEIIYAAKESGANAVKLQTYTAGTLTIPCNNRYFRIGKGSVWEGRNLYDLYSEAYTPWEWHLKLKEITENLGLDFFSTAFDATSVDFLEDLNVPIYKIASLEIVDIPLIQEVARTHKPLIISTGMATLEEIGEAVKAARDEGASQIALLKCTSAYPTPLEQMNLRTIPNLAETFHVPVGLSDHSPGVLASVTAVALGACIIEKHFTLSRSNPGPDSSFSLEPDELKMLVEAVRTAEKALGEVSYGPSSIEEGSLTFRRSLFIVRDTRRGEKFTNENVRSIRPGQGLHTRYLLKILGRRARVDIKKGTPLDWNLID